MELNNVIEKLIAAKNYRLLKQELQYFLNNCTGADYIRVSCLATDLDLRDYLECLFAEETQDSYQ